MSPLNPNKCKSKCDTIYKIIQHISIFVFISTILLLLADIIISGQTLREYFFPIQFSRLFLPSGVLGCDLLPIMLLANSFLITIDIIMVVTLSIVKNYIFARSLYPAFFVVQAIFRFSLVYLTINNVPMCRDNTESKYANTKYRAHGLFELMILTSIFHSIMILTTYLIAIPYKIIKGLMY